jgi:chromosome partitioning protein
VADQIKGTDFALLDLLPADFSYRNLDLVLGRSKHSNSRLGRVLEPVENDYDLVVLDCPPSISLASENVLEVADTILVPLIPAGLSVRTYEQLTNFVSKLAGRQPALVGFFSMVDLRRRLHRDVVDQLRGGPGRIAEASIPASALIEQMASRRRPVTASHPKSPAAEAYRRLWAEVGPPSSGPAGAPISPIQI